MRRNVIICILWVLLLGGGSVMACNRPSRPGVARVTSSLTVLLRQPLEGKRSPYLPRMGTPMPHDPQLNKSAKSNGSVALPIIARPQLLRTKKNSELPRTSLLFDIKEFLHKKEQRKNGCNHVRWLPAVVVHGGTSEEKCSKHPRASLKDNVQ